MLGKRLKNFLSLTNEEKRTLILEIQQKRLESLAESIKKRAKRKPRSSRPKKKMFDNEVLNKLFDQMPPDMQKAMKSKKRVKL